MKLIWKSNKTKKSVRIEKMVTSLTWSGADTQASRTVEFDLVNSPYDPEIKRPNVKQVTSYRGIRTMGRNVLSDV